jgi:solute carrier family 39 (zinc transporter), member 1/2/3
MKASSYQHNIIRPKKMHSNRWGLAAVLLLAKANAATLWHQRENFKEFYNNHRGHTDGIFGERTAGKPGFYSLNGGGQDAESCVGGDAINKPARASQSHKHFVPRFSRLSKRIPSRPVECCSECHECMSHESLLAFNCPRTLLSVRGGHSHHHSPATQGVAETAAAAVAAVTPYGIPLNAWKVIFQAMLTTINVVCWLVPLRSKKITDNKLALSLANAFSGGVFLSLAFGHLIPECIHGFNHAGGEINEALPYMIVLGGYLLIFFVEKVAFDAHEIMHNMEAGGHAHSHGKENGNDALEKQEASGGRGAVILLGALAVHSILEMTALGLANTFGDSALLSLSIALHQPAESIALLVAFLKSGMPKPDIVKYLSIFSCMGPVGVAIGMAVNSFATPIVDATMLAVVAGTFVYVGATEVIPEEWEDPEHKWKKFFSLIGGIVSIFAITQYTMTLESS